MENEGPVLESLTRRLEECPEEFLLAPGVISVNAIASDHMRAMGVSMPQGLRDEVSLVAIVCWLLHDDWFLGRPQLAPRMERLLNDELGTLAATVQPKEFVTDPIGAKNWLACVLRNSGFGRRGKRWRRLRTG